MRECESAGVCTIVGERERGRAVTIRVCTFACIISPTIKKPIKQTKEATFKISINTFITLQKIETNSLITVRVLLSE